MGKNKNKKKKKELPLVSICTPTFNRRPFIPYIIKCFEHQDYPREKMEWIIIDDGTDKIEDLVKDISGVKYFKYDNKMSLGKKRNLMHEKSSGEILVYMDDDDYYPPQRVSHAVDMLLSHPSALCAGSSEIYIYFKHINQMYQFGPYGPRHATAGTFAFKRQLLKDHKYDDDAALAEEKKFLNNYTVPFVQLDPLKVILVFSHIHNTFDKKTLLDTQDPRYCKPSSRSVDEFIKEPELKNFYMNEIESLLENYAPGHPREKPDVLFQIEKLKEERSKMLEDMKQKQQLQSSGQIVLNQNGQDIPLNMEQILDLLKQQQQTIAKLTQELQIKTSILDQIIKRNKELEILKK